VNPSGSDITGEPVQELHQYASGHADVRVGIGTVWPSGKDHRKRRRENVGLV